MKTYAKGEWKKKLPVVILSVALGMTMIPATCMAAEFNSGDTIKEQTVEDLELSSEKTIQRIPKSQKYNGQDLNGTLFPGRDNAYVSR